jgi:non-specific protein-tyrosine kinase
MTAQLIALTEPASPAAEAYRRLRVNLTTPAQGAPPRTLMVVAASPDVEKLAVVANLAVTFARVGKRVVVVDADLRDPGLHTVFGVASEPGLSNVLRAPALGLPLQETGVPGLRVLASGPLVEVPSELLASPAVGDIIARLRDEADIVLFDVPPVIAATDAAELAPQVDGVLLVVAAGRTKRDDARRALELLTRVGAPVIGATLVNAPAGNRLA